MSKLLKAAYGAEEKPLIIGDIEIPCYVLEDGKRVITQRGLFKALGMQAGGSNNKYKEFGGAARLATFLDKYGLTTFNPNGLEPLRKPIIFSLNNTIGNGYEAILLQEIVRAISKAYLRGQLSAAQEHIGRNAEILDDAFAKVGIIALVDEVTGYQHVRERNALFKILEAYISPTLLPWTKRFPDEFYKEIFRLNNWAYDPESVKRPGVLGTWTNQLIYEQLPKGVLAELKNKTPKKTHLHRSLTVDVGHPHLSNQLAAVTAVMRMSPNWRKFKSNFARAFNTGQTEIDFGDEDTDE